MLARLSIALFFCLMAAFSAQAQEHSYGKEEPVHELNDHHALDPGVSRMHPPDSAYFGNHLEYSRNAVNRSRSRLAENRHQEDEALRFNFLYFIIQKFKITEIID